MHGRHRAGGSSSGRFARRREGQARVALEAAAAVAVRVLAEPARKGELDAVVLGGDRGALERVLGDRRLERLRPLVEPRVLAVPDPRLRVLERLPDRFLATLVVPAHGGLADAAGGHLKNAAALEPCAAGHACSMQTYSTQTSDGPSVAGDSSATGQAKDKAQQAAGQAQAKAQEAAGQAKGALRSQVDQRSTEAGDRVGGFASDVRSVSEQLREQGKDQPARLAEQAADRAEGVSRYLRESDADRILSDVEDFGRRQPWAVIAGGVALGLVASRFLKASSTRRYDQRSANRDRLPARTYDVAPGTSGIPTGAALPATPPPPPATAFERSR